MKVTAKEAFSYFEMGIVSSIKVNGFSISLDWSPPSIINDKFQFGSLGYYGPQMECGLDEIVIVEFGKLEQIVRTQISGFTADFYGYDNLDHNYSTFFQYLACELDSDKFESGLRTLIKYLELVSKNE